MRRNSFTWKANIVLALCLAVLVSAGCQTGKDTTTLQQMQTSKVKTLSKPEIESLLAGSRVRGENTKWVHTFNPQNDGSVSNIYGSSKTGSNDGPGTSGTWSATEDGKLCLQLNWSSASEKWCGTVYKAEDAYYVYTAQDPASAWRYKFTVKN